MKIVKEVLEKSKGKSVSMGDELYEISNAAWYRLYELKDKYTKK